MGKVLAYTATFDQYYTTAIPKYGAERRGAPLSTSVRIDRQPIRRHAQISKPTDIIALDVSLGPRMIPQNHFKGKGSLTLNADSLPAEYEMYTPRKIGICNVQEIAKKVGLVKSGSTMIGIPMLGAFIATTEILSMNSLHQAIDKIFRKSMYLEANHKAVDLTYKQTEVKVIEQEITN